MNYIEKAVELKEQLDSLRPLDKQQEARIMQKFRLDWDYHSNHLEGNLLTFGETKALILFGITAQGKPLKDHIEITGHDEAIKWILEIVKKDYPLNERFIRELHTLLLKEPYEKEAQTPDGQRTTRAIQVGKYKIVPNHVRTKTGEIFYFASPEETPALMHDLIEWYRKQSNQKDINPILLAAEFHYRFIRIHPFDDGNGRTARILMNFILLEFNYPPVIIKTEDRNNYFAALQQADSGQIEPFIEYIAKNLILSLELMIAGAKGENIDEENDFDKEISLLNQKVQALQENIKILRNRDRILELYDDSILKLITRFISTCEKFNKFYNSYSLTIQISDVRIAMENKTEVIENNIHWKKTLREKITDNTRSIWIKYDYAFWKADKMSQGSHDTFLSISFDIKGYKVIVSNPIPMGQPRPIIPEYQYGIQLSDEQIDELIKFDFQRHRDSIERRIKNAPK